MVVVGGGCALCLNHSPVLYIFDGGVLRMTLQPAWGEGHRVALAK